MQASKSNISKLVFCRFMERGIQFVAVENNMVPSGDKIVNQNDFVRSLFVETMNAPKFARRDYLYVYVN